MVDKQNIQPGGKRFVLEGVKDLLPMIPGVLPFGLITGANSASLGLSPEMTIGATLLFFAGSAQLAAYQLIQDNALPVVILFTTLMVNIRFVIYSAAFAPLLHTMKIRHKWPLAYLLSDQAYGLCASKFAPDDHGREKLFYYIGAAVAMWASWVACVIMGMLVGEKIPSSWSLEFAIPLAFLAMLVSIIRDRVSLITAVSSAVIASCFVHLPYNMGFISAIIGGVIAGFFFSSFFSLVRLKNQEGRDG
ncbi:branched-chain amino acid permease [Zobellella endophytica]|uniref:Branched-chain amino acid permease n=1 Tax=Zobellella endophytica TaxID=2116700 RepID=A0A2P7RB41_9GAMM|nr:AzlC family ABC transporter permease [Zobellella endophytica]PSJ47435.1 branched-chain amino acid permease [Zobellella endophytica]